MKGNPDTPTIHHALARASERLQPLHDTPIDAEVLLCFVLKKNRAHLRAWPEKRLSPIQWQQFQQLLDRRIQGEPIAYITGQREFWSMPLSVTPDTLIPRPDTEILVEQALKLIPQDAPWQIADVGTGSGAIALAIASERPHCQLHAIDISAAALTVAQDNARRLGIHNICFIEGQWLNPLTGLSLEMVVSNPPYIEQDDPHLGQGDVRFEPITALASGSDGLDDIRIVVDQAKNTLKPGGWLLMEHGYHQGRAVVDLLQQRGYSEIKDFSDYAGHDRVACGQYNP
jgi:release factor glutamine methyltransferase